MDELDYFGPENEFEDYDEADAYADDEPSDGDVDTLEADGEALASAGMGTNEDYGYFGGEDDYLDGSYES